MSVANAIVPNNFVIHSDASGPTDKFLPESYSVGYPTAGQIQINPGPLTLFSSNIPAGDWIIDYQFGLIGSSEPGGGVQKSNILAKLKANGMTIAEHEYLDLISVPLPLAPPASNAIKNSVYGQIVVRFTAPVLVEIEFSIGPEDTATTSSVIDGRGMTWTRCRAEGNFITI